MSDSLELDFTELFKAVNEMVQVFTEGRIHPMANCGDILVRRDTDAPSLFAFKISFMVGYLRVMTVDFDAAVCAVNPQDYFERWIDYINAAYKQQKVDLDMPLVYLPSQVPALMQKNALATAINMSGAVH